MNKRSKLICTGLAGVGLLLAVTTTASAASNINLQGGLIFSNGYVNAGDQGLSFTSSAIRGIGVSAGQLSGVNPETGAVITNASNLLPLKAQSLAVYNKVGIGTTNPSSLTEIVGGVLANGGRLVTITTTNNINGLGLALNSTGAGNNNLGFSVSNATKASFAWDNNRKFFGMLNYNYSPNDFSFRLNSDGSLTYHDSSSGSERFRVRASGNVGIGTTNPVQKLEVVGNVKANSFIGNGAGLSNLNASVINSGTLNASLETDPQVGANGANYVSKWNGSALVSGTVYDNGSVGIGTTSPAEKLEVVGNVKATAFVGNGSGLTINPAQGDIPMLQ